MNGPFVWDDGYRIGIDSIDAQHRDMFRMANLLYGPVEPEELNETLASIYRHTRTHFMEEEELMQDAGYPGLRRHRQQHTELLEKLTRLSEEVARDPGKLSALRGFLAEWIVDHILTQDMHLQYFIDNKRMDLC